ncbi:MAG: acyl-CoA dehydrogenase family protein, partial [Pseudomonadota bacterium]
RTQVFQFNIGCKIKLHPAYLELIQCGDLTADTALSTSLIYDYGAMLRSAQIAGALDALTAMSVQYASERIQFGKPIGKFQAIQQSLAQLATQTASVGLASEVAFRAAVTKSDPRFEIAVAKIRAGEASELATSIAHQTHGAIGFTYEHNLHFATRRLWAWRAEFGTDSEWAEKLGSSALSEGGEALWPYVTAR